MTQNANQRVENQSATATTELIRCLVIESDESIRWSLSFLLQNSGIWQIVGECDRIELGLARLDAISSTSQPVQVLLLGLGDQTPDRLTPILQSIRSVAPALPIVVLGQMPASAKMVERLAVGGYWWKGDRLEVLLDILTNLSIAPATDRAVKPSRIVVSPDLAALARLTRASGGTNTWLSVDPRFAVFDRTLAELNWQLRSQRLSWIDRSVIAGRIRELQTARWIAQQLLPKQVTSQNSRRPRTLESSIQSTPSQSARSPSITLQSQGVPESQGSNADSTQITTPNSSARSDIRSARPTIRDPRITRLFDQFTLKLTTLNKPRDGGSSKLENRTSCALELDILIPDRRYQLLMLTAQVLQAEVQHMLGQHTRLSQLYTHKILFLETIWETVTTQFFVTPERTAAQSFNLVPTLLKSRSIVSDAILKRIPLTGEWLAYLLFQTPLTIDNCPYPAGSPEGENRALTILENITIQIANAVLQPLINQFSNVESIKGRFFHPRYTSSRDLTKFRNDLSWSYRRDRWIDTPTNIFESQYRLTYLTIRGIQSTSIYAPRSAELQALEGFPLVVTLALETRDALSPRLRSALAFIGSGVVYVLTEVVGRGIGLIGRGIVKGIGSAWQERR